MSVFGFSGPLGFKPQDIIVEDFMENVSIFS